MTHSFEIEDANKYGVSEAIVLYNLRHWVRYNKANRLNIHDGRVWTYNSTRALAELFPYFTSDMIRRYLEKLEAARVIVTGNYNKRPGDRTKWYSVAGEEGQAPEDEQKAPANPPLHLAKSPEHLANPPDPIGESAAPLPDINQILNPDINTHTERAAQSAEPEPPDLRKLDEPLKLYAEHCFPFDRIGNDPALIAACHRVGVDTVARALMQCAQEAQKPGHDKKFTPHPSSLLHDTGKLIKRAELYKPEKPKVIEISQDDATVQWLENMTHDERQFRFDEAEKHGLLWAQAVLDRWPEAFRPKQAVRA